MGLGKKALLPAARLEARSWADTLAEDTITGKSW
jgi:hypothetical protein